MNDLRESTEVNELLETLEKNGMEKEKSEVNALVDYIGDMEKTLTAMLTEMQEMRKEVNLIHDNTLRAKCGALVQNAESKIRQGISVIGRVKDNIIKSAKNAVEEFKTKGKEAFKNAMRKMMIPETLDKLSDMFHKFSKSMEQDAQNLENARSEFQNANHHFGNAIRGLFGKEAKEQESVKTDKGILAKLSKFHERLSSGFASLEKKTMDLADKMRVDRVKTSVRDELKYFKSGVGSPEISFPSKDKAR